MIKEIMIEHGAPTLAGIKTGNIFSLEFESEDCKTEIREINMVLTKKGLRLIPDVRGGPGRIGHCGHTRGGAGQGTRASAQGPAQETRVPGDAGPPGSSLSLHPL